MLMMSPDFKVGPEFSYELTQMGIAVEAWTKAKAKVAAYEAKYEKAAPQSYYRAMWNCEDRMRILGI